MTDAPQTPSPDPSNDSDATSKPTPRPTGGSVYLFSFRWFLAGLLTLLILGAAFGGLYFYRVNNLTKHVLGVARQLIKESDELIKKADDEKTKGKSDDEVRQIKLEAYKKKEQAANLLIDFRRQQRNDGDPEVLIQLLDILEDTKSEGRMSPIRRNQILTVCQQLLGMVQEKDSLPYRKRILELEWENGNLNEVMLRAKDVLVRSGKAGRDDYDAWRYLTMAMMFQIGTVGYQQPQGEGSLAMPSSMNELLDKVYRMKPEDIEIAVLYADFVKDGKRKDYLSNSSEDFRKLTDEERDKKAIGIINDMVNRNADNSRAYLVRYRFKVKYNLLSKEYDKLDSDLGEVLRLSPNDTEGLVLAGVLAYQQSFLARRDGDTKTADERKDAAEKYYLQDIKANPENTMGYQFLGDFYMNEGKPTEAVRVWKDCLEKNPKANQEIIGRLVIGLIQLKKLDEADDSIGLLENVVKEYRLGNQLYANRIQNLIKLLSARLYDAQGAEAITKADAATVGGKVDEAKKFYAISQKKYADASQILNQAFESFGKSAYDYVVDPTSIHSRIISESLMLAGRLASDRAEWDRAASYYQKAAKFPQFREQAAIAAAAAYQQMNLPSEGTQLLAEAVQQNPDSVPLRNIYAQNLFRQEMSRVDPATRDLEAVEKQFRFLSEHKDQLTRPWMVDFRLIHLELIRESSSLDPERSIKAVHTAVKKYKSLESAVFSTPAVAEKAEGDAKDKEPPKKYSDDLTFLADIAGVYSSLSALPDFDRVLLSIREFPQGEPIYFEERINDALRRNDKEGALAVIEEAQQSDTLTPTQKQNFASISQKLKDDQPQTLDKLYAQLKTTYDQNPDSLKPQVFFLMANMALDRDDTDYAKVLQERLETIEGSSGTMWKYIKARSQMMEKDPPMDSVKQLLQEILDRRPDWDMSYTLQASIEERQLQATPEDKELKRKLIDTYRQALRCGNVQQAIWNRLLFLLEETELFDEVRKLQQDAILRGVRLDTAPGQFPQPYQRLYTQVHSAIVNQDPQQADLVAKQCMVLAQNRRENPELIYSLNLGFGKLFMDNDMLDSAKRHLSEVAKRGGSYVYPLAVCYAKDRQVDKGFAMLLDELDKMPSALPTLLPSVLVLLAQVKPSEAVFERLDKIVTRIEKGERQILRGQVKKAGPENIVEIGIKRIHSMTVRFPDSDVRPDPETLKVLPPETEESAGE